jgi:hypothetical protein
MELTARSKKSTIPEYKNNSYYYYYYYKGKYCPRTGHKGPEEE